MGVKFWETIKIEELMLFSIHLRKNKELLFNISHNESVSRVI